MIRRPTFDGGGGLAEILSRPATFWTFFRISTTDSATVAARREPKFFGVPAVGFRRYKVSAILIISVFLLFVASFAILRTKRSRSQEVAGELPDNVSPRGLFDAPADETPKLSPEQARRDQMRARAARGDLSALAEASATGEAALYRFVLQCLVGRASGDAARVRELAAQIAGG